MSLDYFFFGDDKVKADDTPMLCTYDNATDSIHAYVTKKKGVNMWIAKAVGTDLESTGYGGVRVCLKSDQEESVLAVKTAIAERRSAPTSMMESPARESKSNGKMERAVQKLEGQLRTLKMALEHNIGKPISFRSKVSEWLTSWTTTSLNRYWVGEDGKTAMQRATGHQCNITIAEFGEQVHWKRSVSHNSKKAKSLWEEGTFLGLRERTGEIYVATSDDEVHKCRTMRSRIKSERWNTDRVLGVKSSVASVVYKFGVDSEETDEDANQGEPERNEEQVADMSG